MWPHFIWHEVLYLLPLAPLIGFGGLLVAKLSSKRLLGAWGNGRLTSLFACPPQRWQLVWKGSLMSVAVAAVIVALARPSYQSSHYQLPADTTVTNMMIDVSTSMAADDSGGAGRADSRLETALDTSRKKIIPACEGNTFGMVTFAGEAFPQVLPTRNMATSVHFLNRIQISDAPGQGSNVGPAFDLAFRYFDWVDARAKKAGKTTEYKRVLIFWSDGGADDNPSLANIIKGCNDRKIQLLIFGVGEKTPVAIPVKKLSRQARLLTKSEFYESDGEVQKTALDDEPLMALQKGTQAHGSRYQHVTNAEDVHLERIISGVEMVEVFGEQEVFIYPTLVFIVALLAAALVNRRWDRRQQQHPTG